MGIFPVETGLQSEPCVGVLETKFFQESREVLVFGLRGSITAPFLKGLAEDLPLAQLHQQWRQRRNVDKDKILYRETVSTIIFLVQKSSGVAKTSAPRQRVRLKT